MGLPALANQTLEIQSSLFSEPQLAGIGPSFLNHRGRLAPEELGAARAKSAITTKRQLIRPAVERPVAALHRLNTERIADAELPDIHTAEQRTEIVREAEVKPETFGFRFEFGPRSEFEVARQGIASSLRLTWSQRRRRVKPSPLAPG